MRELRKRSSATVADLAATLPAPREGVDYNLAEKVVEEFAAAMPVRPPEPEPPAPPLILSANKGPKIAPDIERIVETLYQVDAWREYQELEKNLEIGEDRGDYRTLLEALDKAEARARKAHRLYLAAKLERASWEMDSQVVNAAMRKVAVDDLEADKAQGRKKLITDADVVSRMAESNPDEWRSQEIRRAKLKGAEEHLERLADLWKARCRTLETMLSTLRK